ncbi:PREDICTED: tRNA(adenine(34)) deaminase, chloroplastic [Nelumbo nucifera]|uniref:tRNA(adenine(34)) deaminase n=2 Tax=Nelumbo nucifera TaxID=4432 RepID=A0A822YSX8_NELNU|nr:PREDICTED: tRNA(adenine(34)) deaminase, chloroplastic [Nelumbo nucifera]DAD35203.1 TPA_asm: hypothetical protein HUJ06_005843 [Nelumbo nucifera]
MHNIYISSGLSFRSKESLSYSFNDFCYFLHERIGNTSASPCACCAFSVHGVPVNPRILYGLRQSTLIHRSASRRLILGGLDRYCRLPVCDLDRVCYRISCSLKESNLTSRRRRPGRRDGKFGCMVWEEKSERCDLGVDGSAEAMLSLLTEEVNQKFFGVREKNARSVTGRVRVEKRGRAVHECSKEEKEHAGTYSSEGRARVEQRGSVVNECSKEEKEHAGTNSLERKSKGEYRAVKIKSREELYQQSGRREASSNSENRGARTDGSSCSSYYSVSSGDLDDSVDVQVEHEELVGESSSDKKESRGFREEVFVGDIVESDRYGCDDTEEYRGLSSQRKASVQSDAMGIDFELDLRKKTEKKLTEVLVGNTETRKESSQRFSAGVEIHKSGTKRSSTSQNQLNVRKKDSNSTVNLTEETRKQDNQIGLLVNEQLESRRESQLHNKMSEICQSDIQMASSSLKQSSGREGNFNSAVNLIQEARDRHSQMDHVTIEQAESRSKLQASQQLMKMSEAHVSDTKRTSTSQRVSESRINNRVENSTSILLSVQEGNNQQNQTDQEFSSRTDSKFEPQDLTNTENILVQSNEREKQASESFVEKVGLRRKESQRPIKMSGFHKNSTEGSCSFQRPSDSVPQGQEQQIDAWKEDERNSQVMITPPPSQLIPTGSPNVKLTGNNATQELSSEASEGSISTMFTHLQGEACGTTTDETCGKHPGLIFHEDVLGSADRLEKSSTHFVGEFVKKLIDEVPTSEIQKQSTSSEETRIYKDEKYMQQTSSHYASNEFQSTMHSSRQSSDGSGSKGPPVEMWDVVEPSLQEAPKTEAPEETAPTTESVIVRRTGKSLWSIIGDIIRLRWGTRAETHNSAAKSSGRSSSNESVSSDTWFSGHEPDDNDDANFKGGRRNSPKEPKSVDRPQQGKTATHRLRGTFEATTSLGGMSQVEGNMPSYSGLSERGSTSQGASSARGEEDSSRKENGKRDQIVSTNIRTTDSSSQSPRQLLIRSPAIDISESSKVETSTSNLKAQVEQPVGERLAETSGTEGKDGQLKHRKLQRAKQVPKDRFDEWEEAYKLETEQRKIDEMFMREALLEAKKAADTWEVPVGAVLVQDGKIIARGCNLVEELRDSTAHAEMICIREASNLLQTWRLAETTLYVTLEPCPMCAGAILQARIDTLVWGAPNKLLGADGSWVRLFPGGGAEGSGSDVPNQPAGPVHPFHPKMMIRRGILATECADVMQQFFQLRRRKKEKKPEPPTPPPSCLPISNHPSKFLSKMHDIFSIMFCL